MINDVLELASHLGARFDDPKKAERSVAQMIYQDSPSGVGITFDETGVALAGYCEGIGLISKQHHLPWGFSGIAFTAACGRAELDAEEIWDTARGCEDCGRGGAVNSRCTSCRGHGIIL